jgi:hypothetical protein
MGVSSFIRFSGGSCTCSPTVNRCREVLLLERALILVALKYDNRRWLESLKLGALDKLSSICVVDRKDERIQCRVMGEDSLTSLWSRVRIRITITIKTTELLL